MEKEHNIIICKELILNNIFFSLGTIENQLVNQEVVASRLITNNPIRAFYS